ncbi:hypothetical protein J7298_04678 [Nakaseomyces glabratus]|nr:hypothetical protein J7298_04678 [Nakaseomyces glabratus]
MRSSKKQDKATTKTRQYTTIQYKNNYISHHSYIPLPPLTTTPPCSPQNSTHIPYLPNFSLFPPFPAPITTTIPPTRPSISLPHHPCHHPLTRHMTLHTYSTPAPRTPP